MFESEITRMVLLVLSTILVVISMARYIYSIVYGITKPNMIGWALYQIATLCVLLSAFDLSSTPTIVLTSTFAISQFIVILLSLKYGYVKFSRVEGFLFFVSLVCLLFWIIVTNRPDYLSILHMSTHGADVMLLTVNTGIEIMGALAIFIKLYHHPGTEDSISWFFGWISGLLALLAVDAITYVNVLYPSYLVVTNLAIWLLCFRENPRWRILGLTKILAHFSGESRTGLIYERVLPKKKEEF